MFASHTCESAKTQSLSVILEKYLYCACVSIFPWVCVGRVNSLALPFAFTFAFASHMWTSLQILRWNDIPIITELNKFSIWQCFFYVEPSCFHFTTFYHSHRKNDKQNKRLTFWTLLLSPANKWKILYGGDKVWILCSSGKNNI